MINILLVDDSPTIRELVKEIFENDTRFEIYDEASSGNEAIQKISKVLPDVILLDLLMKDGDGLDVINYVMTHIAVPIAVLTSEGNLNSSSLAFSALEAGALAILEKPNFSASANIHIISDQIKETILNINQIPKHKIHKLSPQAISLEDKKTFSREFLYALSEVDIIGLGGSTGAPQVIKILLSQLPSDLPVPIVIVQHISDGFNQSFIQWLQEDCCLPINEAKDGETLENGKIYIAPEKFHVEISRYGNDFISTFSGKDAVNGFRPSVDVLFSSLKQASSNHSIGILLSGMGVDGADGMLKMRQAGAITLAQDSDSAVVNGMIQTAISKGAVAKIMSQNELNHVLQNTGCIR